MLSSTVSIFKLTLIFLAGNDSEPTYIVKLKFFDLDMKVYYRNPNNNIFTVDIKPDETMKKVAVKIQNKTRLNPCHVSITMVNNVCHCGKRTEHLLLQIDIFQEL